MANAIRAAVAPQPYRITLSCDSAPSTAAADYALVRHDGGACGLSVSLVWIPDGQPTIAELALSGPLLDGVVYSVAVAGAGSALVAYRTPIAQPSSAAGGSAPEATAFGFDVGWLGDRAVRRRGLDALRYDLVAIAVTEPGELFHRPLEGAGLRSQVNGPVSPVALGAAVKRQWSRDSRVAPGGVSLSTSAQPDGLTLIAANVRTVALDSPVAVQVEV